MKQDEQMETSDNDEQVQGPNTPEEEKLTKSQKKRNKKNKKKQATKAEDKKVDQPKRESAVECNETIDAMWESEDDGFDVDAIIDKLLSVSKKNPGTLVALE
jgi:hypothetical protein